MVRIRVVSVPASGSVTPIACSRSSPLAIFGSHWAFCAAEPCRSSVPILYIWPWHAPALPPARLISSMITDASASPSPDPPILLRDQRRQPPRLGQRRDEGIGIAAGLVDRAEVLGGKSGAQGADGLAQLLELVGIVEHGRTSKRRHGTVVGRFPSASGSARHPDLHWIELIS